MDDMMFKGRRPFDNVPEARRRIMQKIGNRDTGPERQVRSMLHHAGYRFRKHGRRLPGQPDILFTARRKAIFIHGCFWHHHVGCKGATLPKTRTDYWRRKLDRTMSRDEQNTRSLRAQGWDVLVIWECEMQRGLAEVKQKLEDFLGPVRVYDSPKRDDVV